LIAIAIENQELFPHSIAGALDCYRNRESRVISTLDCYRNRESRQSRISSCTWLLSQSRIKSYFHTRLLAHSIAIAIESCFPHK